MRILLAEDDPHISVIIQLCLEKIGGHSVTLAFDGQAVLDLAWGERFDLILLDGMMPKKSGLEVARALRTVTPNAATPIIFLSARLDEKEYLDFGVGFIAKPFDPATICQRIETIMNRAPKKAVS